MTVASCESGSGWDREAKHSAALTSNWPGWPGIEKGLHEKAEQEGGSTGQARQAQSD